MRKILPRRLFLSEFLVRLTEGTCTSPLTYDLCLEAVNIDYGDQDTRLHSFSPTRNKRTEVGRRGHSLVWEWGRNVTLRVCIKVLAGGGTMKILVPNLVMSTETSELVTLGEQQIL